MVEEAAGAGGRAAVAMLRPALAWLHLVALAIGFAAIWMRAGALSVRPLNAELLRRAFAADTAWGIAAALWLGTGLWRLIAQTEKTFGYYMHNGAFHAKMGLFLLILILELWPMATLIRWRRAFARDATMTVSESQAGRIAAISRAQALLVILMILAANLMARGYGSF